MKRLVVFLLLAFPMIAQDHQGHDLTTKDIVSILADYTVRHETQQPFYRPAYGVTDFEANPPTIWIFNTGDNASKRGTVIHELLHVYYHQRGVDDLSEEFITKEEWRLYHKLFGEESDATK